MEWRIRCWFSVEFSFCSCPRAEWRPAASSGPGSGPRQSLYAAHSRSRAASAIFGKEQRCVDHGSRARWANNFVKFYLRLDYLGCGAVTLPSLLDWSPVARLVSSTAPHASRTRARLAARTKKARLPIPAWRVSLAEKVVRSASCVADSGSPRSSSLSAIGSTRYSFGLVPRAINVARRTNEKRADAQMVPKLHLWRPAIARRSGREFHLVCRRAAGSIPRQQFIGKAQIGNKMLPRAIGIQSIANSQQI